MILRSTFGALAALLLAVQGAAATTPEPSPSPGKITIHYTAGLRPHNSYKVPYSGALSLTFTPDGHINGTYRPQSIRPDPLNGRIISVLGGHRGTDINLAFGTGLGFSIRGTIHSNGHITGTGTGSGTVWDFEAVPNQK